jgi:hypothetical protein
MLSLNNLFMVFSSYNKYSQFWYKSTARLIVA